MIPELIRTPICASHDDTKQSEITSPARQRGGSSTAAAGPRTKETMMADVLPSDLMNSVMGKLYDVLANGDATVPQSEDNFFSWATPGIPIEPGDVEFLSQGLTGVVKKADVATMAVPVAAGGGDAATAPATPGLTQAELDALKAQDTAQLYMQAENLARLVDFVPDVTRADNEQFARLSIMNNDGTLSDIYSRVLRMSQVAREELPSETKAKIDQFRKLLTTTVTKKNLIDGSETQVTEPSELVKLYNEKLAAYEDAVLTYNTHRVDALSANNSSAVNYFALNASILRNRVKAAMDDWVNNGYKNEYEQMAAFIDQVSRRDMTLLKAEYQDDLDKARLTGLASGSDFFYTSLIPGNFATSSGWTQFGFTSSDFKSSVTTDYSTKQWKAAGSGGFLGIFGGSGGGGSSSSQQEYKSTFNSDQFGLNFEIAQVQIIRPWFKDAFLTSKSWRFDQADPEAKLAVLSDGGSPPKGMMPAYPTSMILVRNLKLTFGQNSGFSDFLSKNASTDANAGGFVRWGLFGLGGSYNRSTTSGSTARTFGYSSSGQEMTVPGMQVIGFKCHILPKSPDPLPGLTEWV
jgi:hypothetical protein